MKLEKIFLLLIFVLALFLRIYKVNQVPPSLYWEEVALGYDAYSILKTSKDFHGNSFPLVAFESFGDWKPSLYFYTLVPSMAIFGFTPLAVRLPSIFFGSLTVLAAYFLVKELKCKNCQYLALITSLLLAISPWHLQFSKAGFEVVLACFLIVLAVFCFLKAVNKNIWFLILSALFFSLSLYAYHAARIFSPLLALALGLVFFKKLLKYKKEVVLSLLLSLILIFPTFHQLNANPEIKRRFQETSAFATLDPILESNQKIQQDGESKLSRIIHHRFWYYLDIFFNHYFDHFDPSFLFLKGDSNPRHSTQEFGLIYLIEAPFLLAGIFFIFKKKQWSLLPILIWLVLAPVPAAFTKATPHALRLLVAIPSLQILTAYGLLSFYSSFKNKLTKSIFLTATISAYIFCFSQYLHFYFKHYPFLYSQYWQYGYQQMIEYVAKIEDQYDNIYITRQHGRPSIYYFFYNKIDPAKVQVEASRVEKDQGELLGYEKIEFISPEQRNFQDNSLIVLSGEDNLDKAMIKQINFLNNEPAFKIYEN